MQKSPQTLLRRARQGDTPSPPHDQRSARLSLMTATAPFGPCPSAGTPAVPLPFGAACLCAASAEACPPPHYPCRAPLISYCFLGYQAYLTMDVSRCQPPPQEEQGKDRGGDQFRRLPASSRTTPPMNFGSRMHTILTRMCSPPASRNERPARAHQRRARHGRPGPSRDAQKQQQQSRADEHASHQPPQPVVRRTTMLLTGLAGLIPDFSHGRFPRFTGNVCP